MEFNTSLFNSSMDESLNGTVLELPLYITYLKMVTLSVALPSTLIPAMLIMCVITKDKELQKDRHKTNMFLINLLASDVIYALVKTIVSEGLMIGHLLDLKIYASCTVISSLIITAALANKLMYIPVITDCLLRIAFPFDYKRVMTTKAVTITISSCWLLALFLSVITSTSRESMYLPSVGDCLGIDNNPLSRLTLAVPLVLSASLTTVTSIYFYYKIIKSEKFFHSIQRNNEEREKAIRIGRVLDSLHGHLKHILSVFALGGVDAVLNLIIPLLYIATRLFFPHMDDQLAVKVYIQLIVYMIQFCQSLSHSLTYGFCSKKIRSATGNFLKVHLFTKRSKVINLRGNLNK